MKKFLKKIIKTLLTPFVLKDYFSFLKVDKEKRFTIKLKDFYPQIKDKTIGTNFDRHYVYHTSWAARVISEIKPEKHIDISSSLYFSGIVSAFVPVDFYDLRPADLILSNLESKSGNLMSLPFESGSIKSLSCMHTIEHIGLGRYGDPINPDGDIDACKELSRVLEKDGSLLFVTPISDEPRIEWNAHRIYSYDQVLKLFPELRLKEFSLIPEDSKDGGLIRNADINLLLGEKYACGCFHFIK
ncbi:MAG: DUF268 domain-containing protein [Candidatus Paceibacterota bacterium]